MIVPATDRGKITTCSLESLSSARPILKRDASLSNNGEGEAYSRDRAGREQRAI